MKYKLISWLVICCPLAIVLFFTHGDTGSPNDDSRIATIQALVEYNTLALDNVALKYYVDLIMRDGKLYSDKPPMLQFIGAMFYYPMHHFWGLRFSTHFGWIYYLLTLILVGIPYCIICYLLYRSAVLFGLSKTNKIIFILFIWLGTILLPYSLTFNNHILAACLVFIGFYYYIKSEIKGNSFTRIYILLGFLLSLAVSIDPLGCGLIYIIFLILLYYRKRDWRSIGYYLTGSILPITIHFILNYYQIGGLLPVYFYPQYYDFPGSVWGGELGQKRLFATTILGQYFHILIGYRGIFLFSPFLLLGAYELINQIYQKKGLYRDISLFIILSFLGTVTGMAFLISDLGGGSYGLRWLIPFIPLLTFYTLFWLKNNIKLYKSYLGGGLISISILFTLPGLYDPWPSNILSPIPILENIGYMSYRADRNQFQLVEKIIEHTSLEKGLAYYELARFAFKKNHLENAIYYYKKSLEYDPKHALTYYHLGILLDMNNQPELAIPIYDKLIQLEPNNIGALNNFGISLIKTGQYERALEIYQKSVALDENRFSSQWGLAQTLIKLERYSEALDTLKICLEIEPNSIDALWLYSRIKNMMQ